MTSSVRRFCGFIPISTLQRCRIRFGNSFGVYDADGTLLGEARYWIGARLGQTHCALCDITHGLFTERADWRRCRDQLDVAFRTYHRNDAPAEP